MNLPWTLLAALTSALQVSEPVAAPPQKPEPQEEHADRADTEAADLMSAQPRLLRITGTIDGSGRMIFTQKSVRYEHQHWDEPTDVVFGGQLWPDLHRTPALWEEIAPHVDLSKAWIVKRKGRDVIALEQTPDGFDLYFSDSPNGAASYEVLIAIPRRH
jgi:hypothetical protein